MHFIRLRSWLTVRPGRSLDSLQRRFLALDLETTGLDVRRDVIVSLAAIPFVEGAPGPGYVTLVDPGRPIPLASTAIHGVTDALIRGAPPVHHVVQEVQTVFANDVIVGHNVSFDLTILARARRAQRLSRLRNVSLDTALLAARLHPEWRDFTLEGIAARVGVEVVARHTAEGDAVTAGRIFLALVPRATARGLRTLADLLWLQRQTVAR